MKKNIIITIIGAIIILLSINSNESSNNNAFALTYSNNVDLEYTFAPTLDVSFSSNNGSSFNGFVIEDLTPGTAAYSNTVTVTASSNNSDGFTMSATVGKASNVDSYRNNSRLVHSNNTNYFESIATNANVSLDNLGTNKWGYAVYNSGTSTWSNYNGLPVIGTAENPTTGTTLVETDSAGSTSVDMRIGASSTNTQVSGTFTNDINFTITAKIVTYDYAISYNANDGNPTTTGNNTADTTNMPSNANGSLQTGQTLLTSNQKPIRTGYDFLGWCDSTITGATCNGRLYSSNDYIKITNPQGNTTGNTNNITLSAVWLRYIQDLTLDLCKEKTKDAPYTVYDKRDNMPYRVQRLADGNCWMLDNLALDITEVSLDSLKGSTNAEDITLEYLKGVKTGTTSDKYPTSAVDKAWTSIDQNYYSIPMIALDSASSGPCYNAAYCVNDPTSGEWSISSVTQVGIAQDKIGIYYNYCAASAGSYCWGNEKDYTGSPSSDPRADTFQDVTEDICPKNWRLPIGDTNGEFANLYNQYASHSNQLIAFETAFATPLSGRFYSGKAYYQNYSGLFWTSTWLGINTMDKLLVQTNDVGVSGMSNRGLGYSVRCILST